MQQLEDQQQKTLLIGVTYALLDFAEQFPMQLSSTIVMETGGMKGRRKELTRDEVHDILKKQFQYSASAFRIWNDRIIIAGLCKSKMADFIARHG